ncbi:MAG: SUMF1/EgtB/PvdO family nonheme iron enzyme, partial [Pirellula sp.]
ARFVNWLNNSTGGFAAYKFTTGGVNDNIALWTSSDTLDYDASNPYRSKRATYVLPSYNEWYKAAYYSPNDSTYYDFPNGSNTAPTAVANGTTSGTAVYNQSSDQGPANVDQAGGLSPYGVMGLGGNVFEWEESSLDLTNSSGSSVRGFRGGFWGTTVLLNLSSSRRVNFDPSIGDSSRGFRVASLSSSSGGGGGGGEVPEPSTLAIFGLGALGMAYRSRRRKST